MAIVAIVGIAGTSCRPMGGGARAGIGSAPYAAISSEPTRADFGSARNGDDSDQARPIAWRIGDIDPRFHLTSHEFRAAIARATRLWEDAAGKTLFRLDDATGFPVKLEYDHRQQTVLEAAAAERELAMQTLSLESAKGRSGEAMDEFKREEARYQDQKHNWNARLDDYNRRVEEVNRAGGASPSVAAELEAEKAHLQSEKIRITDFGRQVDARLQRANELVRRYNAELDVHRISVDRFNGRFAQVMQTLGQCRRTKTKVLGITIFAYENPDHLAIVLAHEFGHALGIMHVGGDGALMSEVEKGKKASKSLKLTPRDLAALDDVLKG